MALYSLHVSLPAFLRMFTPFEAFTAVSGDSKSERCTALGVSHW